MKTATTLLILTVVLAPGFPAAAQNFSEWSSPVNVGPPVNAPREDYQPFVTKDGLSLYFTRLEAGINRIWVARRAGTDDPWGTPELLPATINVATGAGNPFVTPDGHWLYFNTRGVLGGADVHRSWRQNKKVDSGLGGWQSPVNLGNGVNGSATDQSPVLFEDEETGVLTLYFSSNRSGNFDLYVSTMLPDGSFGSADPVLELNTPDEEQQPTVAHNGRELYFSSNRPGSMVGSNGLPSRDIWVSTRESTSDPWSEPEPVISLNSPFHDGRPSLSWDGSTIYFFSAFRPGNIDPFFDIWMATREKVPGGLE